MADLAGARFLTLGERIEAILEMVRQQLGIALLMKKSVSDSQLAGLKRLDLAESY